ncbi:MAG: bifunctional metallophosphatase/5'-nucleotidase [Pseudoflavonifractor sp.]|nr:bifunctional metallophosphatase/5'-nucleotidase [Pseudoflavonifractor sp.]
MNIRKYLLPAVAVAAVAMLPVKTVAKSSAGTLTRSSVDAEMKSSADVESQRLVILHTNDTHSQIDTDDKDRGGVLRRKVLIDSVRAAEPNVLLVDAGDAVQGTLYFTLYKGEVEQRMLNELGYDVQILGNHEFDNGIAALARNYRNARPAIVSTNYDLSATALDSLFVPYVIKEYDGKRVGILGINLDPKGMIADENAEGVVFLDPVRAASSTAWHLRHNERVDAVIAVTHIGYDEATPSTVPDTQLAARSHDIDIIIGGHTHTEVNPDVANPLPYRVANIDGDTVLVAQTGKSGRYLGEIVLDFDGNKATSRLIPVDSRLDDHIDPALAAVIEPYRAGVDSLMAVRIGRSAVELAAGSQALLNWVSDFVLASGEVVAGTPIDMAIMNKGGIRRGLPAGDVTKGMVMTMLPFENKVYVIDIKGRDLADALDVMASRGGDGVSRGVDVTFDPATGKCSSITINGTPLVPDNTYRVATIDYLAKGGDYMAPLSRGETVAVSRARLDNAMIEYLQSPAMKGYAINPPATVRMHP